MFLLVLMGVYLGYATGLKEASEYAARTIIGIVSPMAVPETLPENEETK